MKVYKCRHCGKALVYRGSGPIPKVCKAEACRRADQRRRWKRWKKSSKSLAPPVSEC